MSTRGEFVAGPTKNLEALRGDIVRRYDELSPRLQQVAKYVLDNPNDMALQTLAVIADRCHVQPSTIVRFAKTFGYDGASQMQELFRDEMLTQPPSPSYAERIRQFNRRAGANGSIAPHDVMREFADSNILALEHLKDSVRKADLERAIDLIRSGQRRLHRRPATLVPGGVLSGVRAAPRRQARLSARRRRRHARPSRRR